MYGTSFQFRDNWIWWHTIYLNSARNYSNNFLHIIGMTFKILDLVHIHLNLTSVNSEFYNDLSWNLEMSIKL